MGQGLGGADSTLHQSEKWPQKFKECCQKEVQAGFRPGLDYEFERRLKSGGKRSARA